MDATLKSESSGDPSASSTKQGGFYLPSRTKVWVLAVCLTLMVGASVYAVFQSLNPDPRNIAFSTRFWYPIETNPNARLQAVRCTNDPDDYACRLNSVAVSGAENLPEIWALGNVGLVLHRTAGQSAWEQLIIAAKEESDSAPPSSATSNRKIPATTQSGTVLVPSLLGLTVEQAQKTAYGGGFQLQVEYESGTSNAMAQQGPPPDLRVLKQSPEPRTLVAPKSSITVILGRAPNPPRACCSISWSPLSMLRNRKSSRPSSQNRLHRLSNEKVPSHLLPPVPPSRHQGYSQAKPLSLMMTCFMSAVLTDSAVRWGAAAEFIR